MTSPDQLGRLDWTPTAPDQVAHLTELIELDAGVPTVSAVASGDLRHLVAPFP